MARGDKWTGSRGRQRDGDKHEHERSAPDRDDDAVKPNPPRTTAGGMTSPKFGSAGSGGAELEPGPERD